LIIAEVKAPDAVLLKYPLILLLANCGSLEELVVCFAGVHAYLK
jgi:hypothetical protein